MTKARSAAVGAAVDVGSNSVHLLVGRVVGEAVEQLHDETELLGLGDVVDQTGRIPEADRREIVHTLARFAAVAAKHGAEGLTPIGTEPLRRAANTDELVEELRVETGMVLHVLSERREAELTYLGTIGAAPPQHDLLVVDIGGGSTELALARPGRQLVVHSLATGSARLSAGVVEHDPPLVAELEDLRRAARRATAGLPPAEPADAVFVGGTATNLVKLASLTPDGLMEISRLLADLPAKTLVERFRVNPRRARQLPAGAALAAAIVEHFRLAEPRVSDASLREGVVLAAHLLGPRWLERLPELLPGATPRSASR